MNIHFEYGRKEKAPLGELVEVCDVALALIHERAELFKLLRANAVSEAGLNPFGKVKAGLSSLTVRPQYARSVGPGYRLSQLTADISSSVEGVVFAEESELYGS